MNTQPYVPQIRSAGMILFEKHQHCISQLDQLTVTRCSFYVGRKETIVTSDDRGDGRPVV